MAATEAVAALSDPARSGVRDLILALADSKRLLGMRYADWMLGAPELETGIACASMAQDEWGHARQLYALLRDFGDDVDGLEHGREPGDYASAELLDASPASWAELVVLNALLDTAFTVQFEALAACCYPPVRQRVEKLCEEERFHAAHGAAWFRRMAAGGAARESLTDAVDGAKAAVLRWFGPDSDRSRMLVAEGVMDATGEELRGRFMDRVAPLLDLVDRTESFRSAELDFHDYDEARHRSARTAPDATTIAMVRGDRNRTFLMD